jgi:hypothetical protein
LKKIKAALAPVLYQLCLAQFPRGSDECTNLILQTCILSIILTAPIGQLLIFLLGKTMLKKRILLYSLPPPPPTMGGPPAAYKGKMPILGAGGTESKAVQIGKPETMEGISVSADNRHKLRVFFEKFKENFALFLKI